MKSPFEVHGLIIEVAPDNMLCVFLLPHPAAGRRGKEIAYNQPSKFDKERCKEASVCAGKCF